MKKIISLLVLLFLVQLPGMTQSRSFKGNFRVIGPGSENADIYINELSITVQPGNQVTVVMHFKGGSHTEKEDYIDLTGTVNGSFVNNELKAKGWINGELKDGKRIDRRQNFISFKGTLSGTQLSGKAYIYEKEEETRTDAFFSFTSTEGAELKPILTFPLGKSPAIFNTGWILGADFKVTGAGGKSIDLSDKISWTGTGTFSPAMGKEVRPVFSGMGKNKVILTVLYDNKKYTAEYAVDVVNALNYARVGSMAECMADTHGCIACPHHVVGLVTSGNPRVLIAGMPVACVGSKGKHGSCCGPNTFVVSGGDSNVLIDGKAVAKLGSATKHCGGTGKIIKL